MEPIHHIITLGSFEEYLLFTIDFEVVELRFPADMEFGLPGTSPTDFWQMIFNLSCDTLGKKRRQVFCLKRTDKMEPLENGIYEYIRHSSNHVWTYFAIADPSHWPRFYNLKEILSDNKNRDGIKAEISLHFKHILHNAAKQGLTHRHSMHTPDEKVFSQLTRILNKKIDERSK